MAAVYAWTGSHLGPDGQRVADRWPGLYLCTVQREEGPVFWGFMGRVLLEPFATGVVRPDGRADGPVWASYPDPKGITARRLQNLAGTVRPREDRTVGPDRLRLWVINDTLAIAALQEDLAPAVLTLLQGETAYREALQRRKALLQAGRFPGEAEYLPMLLSAQEQAEPDPAVLSAFLNTFGPSVRE